jgi:hypothetical protein
MLDQQFQRGQNILSNTQALCYLLSSGSDCNSEIPTYIWAMAADSLCILIATGSREDDLLVNWRSWLLMVGTRLVAQLRNSTTDTSSSESKRIAKTG